MQRFERWALRFRDAARPLVWVHAPSVGEGLQAWPVLEALKCAHPRCQFIYTFFSPSAESFAAALDVDHCDVLPFDTARAAHAVIEAVRPAVMVFSKLDVWPNLVEEAHQRGIPTALISATLSRESSRNSRIARLLLHDAYAALSGVGAVSEADATRLIELGCRADTVRVTGDTRFDQVIGRAVDAADANTLLEPLRSARPTLVAGSTWPADERILLAALDDARLRNAGLRLLIAPHEPTPAHLAPLGQWAASRGLRCARLGDPDAGAADVILVDRVGILGDLYALAEVAFVGGGFHAAGLHSVLEPAAYGVPVIFGPRHTASRDAALLIDALAGRAVSSPGELASLLAHWLGDSIARRTAGTSARRVVEQNAGATQRSVELIESITHGALGPAADR